MLSSGVKFCGQKMICLEGKRVASNLLPVKKLLDKSKCFKRCSRDKLGGTVPLCRRHSVIVMLLSLDEGLNAVNCPGLAAFLPCKIGHSIHPAHLRAQPTRDRENRERSSEKSKVLKSATTVSSFTAEMRACRSV